MFNLQCIFYCLCCCFKSSLYEALHYVLRMQMNVKNWITIKIKENVTFVLKNILVNIFDYYQSRKCSFKKNSC